MSDTPLDTTEKPRRTWGPLRRAWTPPEQAKLESLLEAGYGFDVIAERMGRTSNSIKVRVLRSGLSTAPTKVGLLDVSTIAELLDIKCAKTVTAWITRFRWLQGTNRGSERKAFWRVTEDALMAFLRNPAFWMAWEPERITEPQLKAWAIDLRRGRHRWLHVSEVAERYDVGSGTASQWIANGHLPAVKYGNWWVWEGVLEVFIPPHLLAVGMRIQTQPTEVKRRRQRLCTIEGCDEPARATGLCQPHYAESWKAAKEGRVEDDHRVSPRHCKYPGCNEKPKSKGLCLRHHMGLFNAERYNREYIPIEERRNRLSPRLDRVARFVRPGVGNKDIAEALSISYDNVATSILHLRKHYGIPSGTDPYEVRRLIAEHYAAGKAAEERAG